ncbi:MAG: patatin-like phospholipase family protein [Paludibacteraceae bacterium]|nr:patatin-like phospholipase family protein [Paludibacteraceae bacterium]
MGIIKDFFFTSSRNELTGLCLSGGGALGFAHIGVLQSLEDHNIQPDYISGTSMGAIIGTFYAAGYSPQDMLQMIKEDKLYKITKLMTFRPTFLKSGLSNHHILKHLIQEMIPHNSFGELKKKLQICVVNLTKAEWEIVSDGELDKWVAASASIPGVFEAINHNDTFYVDGGLLNNMPAQGLEEYCQTIIGVDVIPHIPPVALAKPIDTLASSVRAMQHQNSHEGRDICRFLIEPKAIEKYHEFSFEAYQDIYQYGYSATTKYIVENPEMLYLRK